MRKMSKTKRERDELIELIAFRHYLHAPIRILVRAHSSYPRSLKISKAIFIPKNTQITQTIWVIKILAKQNNGTWFQVFSRVISLL